MSFYSCFYESKMVLLIVHLPVKGMAYYGIQVEALDPSQVGKDRIRLISEPWKVQWLIWGITNSTHPSLFYHLLPYHLPPIPFLCSFWRSRRLSQSSCLKSSKSGFDDLINNLINFESKQPSPVITPVYPQIMIEREGSFDILIKMTICGSLDLPTYLKFITNLSVQLAAHLAAQ